MNAPSASKFLHQRKLPVIGPVELNSKAFSIAICTSDIF